MATIVLYLPLTIGATEWRGRVRKRMNDLDNDLGARATDMLLNYETVRQQHGCQEVMVTPSALFRCGLILAPHMQYRGQPCLVNGPPHCLLRGLRLFVGTWLIDARNCAVNQPAAMLRR